MSRFSYHFAVAGWVLALIVHIFSVAGFDVSDKIPFIEILHLGIFVVWIPALIELKNRQEQNQSGSAKSEKPTPPPMWMKIIAISGAFYAYVGFMIYLTSSTGTPDIDEGQYILQEHGRLIKILTKQEYHTYKAIELRALFGYSMAFYGIEALVLFPASKR